MTDYLARLNPEQREAVETLDGPLLVLAGAGTGKTRVLTTRFAHILLTGRAYPGQVLAVTFTNKAAREMRERVAALLGRPAEGLWLGTFHALGARMLRRHAEHVGLTGSFNILDADDQIRLLKQVMEAARLDTKRFAPPVLMAIIQRWKDRGLTPARVTAAEDSDFADGKARSLYVAYQERLRSLNAADFGDLLLYVTELLREHPDLLAQYHRMFRYILVDEYQDTNLVQYLWLRLLAQERKNICCVGDDDQSIYSWRGAEVENILRFEKDFPGARIVRLERNYRSTAPILAAASGLIAHNEGRLGKTLRPGGNDAGGEKISVVGLWDSDEEARMVGDRIETLQRGGHALAEMAVLVRAGFQTRAFEERLITLAVPYRVIGGLRFYERAEIRDAIAYARVLHQPADDLAFERIVNVPRRGVGEQALRTMHEHARSHGIPLSFAAAGLVEDGGLRGKPRESVRALLHGFDRWRAQLARDGHVVTLATLLDESGYAEMWKQDKSPEAPGRLENLREFLRALEEFDTLAGFLDHVSLVMENDENASGDRVVLMTLHAAKGLEFDTVFLPGWEEGVFPSQRTLDETGAKGLEEERRLAYVGLTRARRRAVVSHAANRRIYGNWQTSMPSRFIDELPDDQIERTGPAALQRDRMIAASGFGGQFPMVARRRQPTEAWEQPARPGRAEAIPVGTRVFHQKFGYGTVTATENDRLDIHFETSGDKRVLDRFRGAGVKTIPRRATALETVTVIVPDPAVEPYEAALAEACGVVGLFLDEATGLWHVEGVKERGANEPELIAALAVAALASGVDARVIRHATAAEGWLARSYASFPEQCVGRRFAVRGTHLTGPGTPGRLLLKLDAGAAFGSGEHGSTRGCLRALERLSGRRRPRRILDLGTGSGILAIAAAQMLRRPVLATDIDPWSVRVASANAQLNRVGRLVRFRVADGWRSPAVTAKAPYDLVFANILARPLCAMARDLAARLAPGGVAILAGLLASQVRWVLSAHRRQGLCLKSRLDEGQWATLVLTKPIRRSGGR